MYIYSYSPTLSQLLLKNSFGKVFFPNFGHVTIFAKRNSFFGRNFETEDFFNALFADLWLS